MKGAQAVAVNLHRLRNTNTLMLLLLKPGLQTVSDDSTRSLMRVLLPLAKTGKERLPARLSIALAHASTSTRDSLRTPACRVEGQDLIGVALRTPVASRTHRPSMSQQQHKCETLILQPLLHHVLSKGTLCCTPCCNCEAKPQHTLWSLARPRCAMAPASWL